MNIVNRIPDRFRCCQAGVESSATLSESMRDVSVWLAIFHRLEAPRVPRPRWRGHECDRDTNCQVCIASRNKSGRCASWAGWGFGTVDGLRPTSCGRRHPDHCCVSTGVAQFVIVSGDVQEIAPEPCLPCFAMQAWHPANGANPFDLPEGLGRQIMPDDSFVPPTVVRLVPSNTGVKTAYPTN